MSRAKQDSARKIQFPVLFRRRQRTKTASSKGLAEKVRISKCEHHEEKVRLHEEKVSNSPDLRRLTHERGTRIRFFVLLGRCRHLTSDCRTHGARKKKTEYHLPEAIDFPVLLGHIDTKETAGCKGHVERMCEEQKPPKTAVRTVSTVQPRSPEYWKEFRESNPRKIQFSSTPQATGRLQNSQRQGLVERCPETKCAQREDQRD